MGKHTSKGSAGKKSVSDAPGEVIVGGGGGKFKLPRLNKRIYILCAAAAGLAILIVLVVFITTRHRLPNNISSVCTDSIAADANKYHAMGDISSLTQLTYTIQKKQHYQNDPNCKYIRAEQQLLSGDVNSAEKTINDLEKVYGKDYQFNTKLDGGKASINNLREQLRLMQNAEQNSKARFDPDI